MTTFHYGDFRALLNNSVASSEEEAAVMTEACVLLDNFTGGEQEAGAHAFLQRFGVSPEAHMRSMRRVLEERAREQLTFELAHEVAGAWGSELTCAHIERAVREVLPELHDFLDARQIALRRRATRFLLAREDDVSFDGFVAPGLERLNLARRALYHEVRPDMFHLLAADGAQAVALYALEDGLRASLEDWFRFYLDCASLPSPTTMAYDVARGELTHTTCTGRTHIVATATSFRVTREEAFAGHSSRDHLLFALECGQAAPEAVVAAALPHAHAVGVELEAFFAVFGVTQAQRGQLVRALAAMAELDPREQQWQREHAPLLLDSPPFWPLAACEEADDEHLVSEVTRLLGVHEARAHGVL